LTDRDKKPIGPNKGCNRTSIGIIILIVSGVVLSLIFDIPLAINTDDENYSLYLLSFISALIGSILFLVIIKDLPQNHRDRLLARRKWIGLYDYT